MLYIAPKKYPRQFSIIFLFSLAVIVKFFYLALRAIIDSFKIFTFAMIFFLDVIIWKFGDEE